jgi:uncharacterized coiled-coil DUF342 family protein
MFFKPSVYAESLSSFDRQTKIDFLDIDNNEDKLKNVQSSIYDLKQKLKEIREVDLSPSISSIASVASNIVKSFTIKTAIDIIGFTFDVYDEISKMSAESKISGLIMDYENYERDLSRTLSQAYEYRNDINECFSRAEESVCVINRIRHEIDSTADRIDTLEREKRNVEDEINSRSHIDKFFNIWSLESKKDDIERNIDDCIRKINNLKNDADRANDSIREFTNKHYSVFYPHI